MVFGGARRAAAGRRRLNLLNRQVEDRAIGTLLQVEHDADHGTRTHSCDAKYVKMLPPL